MRFRYRFIGLGVVLAGCFVQSSCTQTNRAADANPQESTMAADPKRSVQASSVAPQAAKPVTDIQSAVRRAVGWHPTILEAAGRVNEQSELIADARSGYLPSIGGGVDLGYDSSRSGDNGPKFNITATQMVYDFGKVSGRVEAETAVHDVRQAEFLSTVDGIIKETIEAAIEIVRNEELAQVADEQIRDVQAIGELVEARTDRGASTRSDSLQAQARLQAAQSTALEISGQKQRWQSTLSALLGGTARLGANTSFATLKNACGASEPDWDRTPAVIAARSQKREADAQVKLARAQMLPTVALEATSRMGLLGGDNNSDQIIGFTVKGDLYNGGSFRARQNAANIAAQTSAAAIATAQYDAQRSWFEAAGQIVSLTALQQSLGNRETMMRETKALYQKQFLDLGTRTLLDVLNAEQEFHAARFDEINTRHDLQKLNLQCAASAGRLRSMFQLERASNAAAGQFSGSVPGRVRTAS